MSEGTSDVAPTEVSQSRLLVRQGVEIPLRAWLFSDGFARQGKGQLPFTRRFPPGDQREHSRTQLQGSWSPGAS